MGTGCRRYGNAVPGRPTIQPAFDQVARNAYYSDIRCGLLHQAEAKGMWLIRRGQEIMLQLSPDGQGYGGDLRGHSGFLAA